MEQKLIYLRFFIQAYVSWNNLLSSNCFCYIYTKNLIQRISFDNLTVITTLTINVVKLINETSVSWTYQKFRLLLNGRYSFRSQEYIDNIN